jgi:hypothetical protein
MTSILLFGGTIALIILAYDPVQRLWKRLATSGHDGRRLSKPGQNIAQDREFQRVNAELHLLTGYDTGEPSATAPVTRPYRTAPSRRRQSGSPLVKAGAIPAHR